MWYNPPSQSSLTTYCNTCKFQTTTSQNMTPSATQLREQGSSSLFHLHSMHVSHLQQHMRNEYQFSFSLDRVLFSQELGLLEGNVPYFLFLLLSFRRFLLSCKRMEILNTSCQGSNLFQQHSHKSYLNLTLYQLKRQILGELESKYNMVRCRQT